MVGYRSTNGLLSLDGISTGSSSLDTVGFFAKDHTLLSRMGDMLNLPGKKDWKGEIVSIKIARDLFAPLLVKDNREMYVALASACRSWAGDELAEEVSDHAHSTFYIFVKMPYPLFCHSPCPSQALQEG